MNIVYPKCGQTVWVEHDDDKIAICCRSSHVTVREIKGNLIAGTATCTDAYDEGYDAGHREGYQSGYEEGFDAAWCGVE